MYPRKNGSIVLPYNIKKGRFRVNHMMTRSKSKYFDYLKGRGFKPCVVNNTHCFYFEWNGLKMRCAGNPGLGRTKTILPKYSVFLNTRAQT